MYYYAMLTLVANELLPTNELEVWVGIWLVFAGILILGLTIGEFASLLSAITKKERERTEELDIIAGVMLQLKIPEEIQTRVYDYYEGVLKAPFVHNAEVYDYLSMKLIDSVKIFQME